MKNEISVISLISYDWQYLPNSIKSYYPYVGEIVLGLDKDRVTWSGNPFEVNMTALIKSLQEIDVDDKISIVEDNFHKSSVAIENDTFERNFLKSQCTNDWIMSFDADEELVNAEDFFIKFVPIAEQYKRYDWLFTWVIPYKELHDSYLLIGNEDGSLNLKETQGFATHKDNTFTYARWTDNSSTGNVLFTPLVIKHWSLCRTAEDLKKKVFNIGHSDEAKKGDPFFDVWSGVNEGNWQTLRNFKTTHLGNGQWERLLKVPKQELNNILRQVAEGIYK